MKVEATLTITPQMMAKAFWEMSSLKQVEFFESLHDVINSDTSKRSVIYGNGEAQWCYMGEDLRKNTKAHDMATSMMAFVFLQNWWEMCK